MFCYLVADANLFQELTATGGCGGEYDALACQSILPVCHGASFQSRAGPAPTVLCYRTLNPRRIWRRRTNIHGHTNALERAPRRNKRSEETACSAAIFIQCVIIRCRPISANTSALCCTEENMRNRWCRLSVM